MRLFKLSLVLVAAAVLALAGGVRADDEEKVPLDKLPKAVADAVKKRFPDAELTGASKEKEDGKTLYEVSTKEKGHKIDVVVSEDGQIQAIEKVITAKDLPKAVREGLAAKYPNPNIKAVEEITKVANGKETLDSYEVVVEVDGKKTEVVLSPEGKIKKEEK